MSTGLWLQSRADTSNRWTSSTGFGSLSGESPSRGGAKLVHDWSAVETHAAWVRGDVSIVDVREQNEHDACRVANVPLVPLSELPGRVADLPVGRPLVVMCRSGQRSARVAQYLGDNGWTDEVHNLEGGILAWAAAGLPYEGETPR